MLYIYYLSYKIYHRNLSSQYSNLIIVDITGIINSFLVGTSFDTNSKINDVRLLND